MTNCYNYLGIACDSDLRHSEARVWPEKSAETLKDHDEDLYVRLACQNNLNRARNLYCTGEYEQFKQLLDVSMSQATKFESWYSFAYVHETYASLFDGSSEFALAHTRIQGQEEGEQARKEAQRLRALLPKGRTDLSDESDVAFERLVNAIQR